MISFLHNFQPQALLLNFGALHIYWYGLFMVLGICAALTTTLILARYYKVAANTLIDLAFWLIIGGLIGARLYDVCLELPYYINQPLDIFKIWQGGLAIHGALIGGTIVLLIFIKKISQATNENYWLSFWKLTALLTPGVALGQAIGRWGNYFNQELFGRPTNMPWGIPIDIINRPLQFMTTNYFQPTFLYESAGDFFIFIILITDYRLYQNRAIKIQKLFMAGELLFYFLFNSAL